MARVVGLTFPKQDNSEKAKKPEKPKQDNGEKNPQK